MSKGGWSMRSTGLVVGILIWASTLLCTAIGSAAYLSDVEELEAFLDGVMASQIYEHNIPGATLAVVKDGEIIVSKGYGFSDLQKRTPVDPEKSLFRPGSVSKLITWTAVMQLVEEGRLDLEVDINNYLDLEIPQELVSSNSTPEAITLKHLLTHTPGFEDRGEGLFVIGEENVKTLPDYLRTYLPARVFPPGEVMAYSNYGSALAGYIVERVSGQSFAEYVEENIFVPLGMENSTFRQPLPEHLAQNMTQAYKFQGGEYYPGDFEFISASPAGALSSTASDMAKFMIAHLQEGQFNGIEILKKETVEEMHHQQFTHHPKIPGMAYGFIESVYNGEQALTHGGATLLFFSGLYLLLEHDLGFFVSYSGGTGMEMNKIFQAFMDRYFPKEYIPLPEPQPGDREASIKYIGEYHPSRSNFTSFEKVLALFQRIPITISDEGHLIINYFGEPVPFLKIEPGLYQNVTPNGTQLVNTIAFLQEPEEEISLVTGGPSIYNRVPWYGSSLLLLGLTVFVLLIMLGTILGWTTAFFKKRLRREYSTYPFFGSTLARLAVWAFTLFTLFFLLGMMSLFTSIHPAYGVPEIVFGQVSSILDILLILPYLLAFLGVIMLVFLFLSWWKGYWTLGGRFYYSLLTFSALGFLWVLYYTKFLSFF